MNESDKPKLNLYVVGELSGDPNDWSEYGSRAIVIAASAEEAIQIAGTVDCAALIQCVHPIVLMRDSYSAVF